MHPNKLKGIKERYALAREALDPDYTGSVVEPLIASVDDIPDLVRYIERMTSPNYVQTRDGRWITKYAQREAAKAYVRISERSGRPVPQHIRDLAEEHIRDLAEGKDR